MSPSEIRTADRIEAAVRAERERWERAVGEELQEWGEVSQLNPRDPNARGAAMGLQMLLDRARRQP